MTTTPNRRWPRFTFSFRDLFAAVALVALAAGFLFPCGPEKMRSAKLAGAVNEARLAGIEITVDDLKAAGWVPGDDLTTIRKKLGRP